MKITVREVAVVKTGQSEKGDWELIKVTSDDGTGYTTFDKKAKQLNAGAVIEAEVTLKEGKASFKKFEVISNPEAVATSANGGGYKKNVDGMKIEYALKAKLQAIERASIEAQTAYRGAIELLIKDKVFDDSVPLIDAALKWGLSKLTATELKEQLGSMPTIGGPEKKEKQPNPDPKFANVGEFFTACDKEGVSRSDVLKAIQCKEADVSKINTEEAWQVVYETIIKPSKKLFDEEKSGK